MNKQEFSASSWRSNQGYTKMHGQPTIKIIIPSQLDMFQAMFSPIIKSTWLYLQYLVIFTQVVTGPVATWVNNTRYCKYSQVLLMMGENIARNM